MNYFSGQFFINIVYNRNFVKINVEQLIKVQTFFIIVTENCNIYIKKFQTSIIIAINGNLIFPSISNVRTCFFSGIRFFCCSKT